MVYFSLVADNGPENALWKISYLLETDNGQGLWKYKEKRWLSAMIFSTWNVLN